MTARDWFNKAQQENFAIGAFNVDNLDIFKAVCEASAKKKSPVMLEFSPGEVSYFGLANIVDLVANAREEYRIPPILLNLDHAKRVEDCLEVINVSPVIANPSTSLGVNSVKQSSHEGEEIASSSSTSRNDNKGREVVFDDIHYDGSELSFEENVENTKKVMAAAHQKGLLVEGEIDRLLGSSDVHQEEINLEALRLSYTDPAKASKFVAETGVDIFAAVFGNVHGVFTNQPDLDFELLSKIREALPATFLSMHGGSGISADQVREAIKIGKIVKVNINTEIRQAFRDALNEEIGESPQESAYYKLTPDIVEAVMAVIEAKIDVLGSADKSLG